MEYKITFKYFNFRYIFLFLLIYLVVLSLKRNRKKLFIINPYLSCVVFKEKIYQYHLPIMSFHLQQENIFLRKKRVGEEKLNNLIKD